MSHTKSVASRRSVIAGAFGAAGLAAQERVGKDAPISPKDNLKVTKLEMFLVKPRWLFLKVHTNAGIVGYGEPITEGRALTCREARKEIEPYLIGKDPRRVAHHWQAIYRHEFLSRRSHPHQRAERHRPGAMENQR